VHLVFDIFQGIGVAVALGIRPYLPGLVAAALAAGDVQWSFKGTDYSFLQSPGFLLALGVLAVALLVLESRWPARLERGLSAWVLALVSVGLGALFFAASLCRGGYVVWPGFVGGAVCAALSIVGARPFIARLRGRLDESAARVGPPLVAEGSGILIAGSSVLAPPVGPIALALVLWLAIRSRRGEDGKYAGLRILR
jgi:hypothetical protein